MVLLSSSGCSHTECVALLSILWGRNDTEQNRMRLVLKQHWKCQRFSSPSFSSRSFKSRESPELTLESGLCKCFELSLFAVELWEFWRSHWAVWWSRGCDYLCSDFRIKASDYKVILIDFCFQLVWVFFCSEMYEYLTLCSFVQAKPCVSLTGLRGILCWQLCLAGQGDTASNFKLQLFLL